jgi:hypothetical protein
MQLGNYKVQKGLRRLEWAWVRICYGQIDVAVD